MRKLSEWAKELPKDFRNEMTNHPDSEELMTQETLKQVIAEFMNRIPHQETGRWMSWAELLRDYTHKDMVDFHVSYWTCKDQSTGKTVRAFDMYHAIDIVTAKWDIPLHQVIYAHNKDSKYHGEVHSDN